MITIVGPTASGKTTLAAHLAATIGGEILSGDSRQVYRAMDIGTGKDLKDYTVGSTKIPYHLIDIRNAGEKFNLFEYQQEFHRAYPSILLRNRIPILCGGTGLYVESILKGYELHEVPENQELRASLAHRTLPELTSLLASYKQLHNNTDTDNAKRAIRAIEIAQYTEQNGTTQQSFPPIPSVVFGVNIERELRRNKISQRLRTRLDEGMIDEIRQLIDNGIKPEDLIYYGLEYKYVTQYVVGELSLQEMTHQLEIAIHQFAKRQMTWFRGMERRGTTIHWIEASLPTHQKINYILEELKKEGNNFLFSKI